MDIKSRLLDAQAIDPALMRMSHEIIEKNQDENEICLFGILRRGVPLAKQIAEKTGIPMTSVNRYLNHLVESQILFTDNKSRNRTYYYYEFLDILR